MGRWTVDHQVDTRPREYHVPWVSLSRDLIPVQSTHSGKQIDMHELRSQGLVFQ